MADTASDGVNEIIELFIQENDDPPIRREDVLILKQPATPRARTTRLATLRKIHSENDGKYKKHTLVVKTYDRTKKHGLQSKPKAVLTLDSDGPNELALLAMFIQNAIDKDEIPAGEYRVVPKHQAPDLERVLAALRLQSVDDQVVAALDTLANLEAAGVSTQDWVKIIEDSGAQCLKEIAAAARMVEYRRALQQLRDLVQHNAKEQAFQSLLDNQPWMFGSEYNTRAPRNLVGQQQQDFLFHRTADNYLEIIEIKRPGTKLLSFDKAHQNHFWSSDVSATIAQVSSYMNSFESLRQHLRVSGWDALGIRSTIIAGRDGSDAQKAAIRELNGRLHGIEVLTYDQLIKIAERVLSTFS